MASSKEYFSFISEQLSCVEGITYRAMMGEYIIYCQGKVIGGIYDDRFLIKPTPAAKKLMPDAAFELPYDGAKEMLAVDCVDDREALCRLISSVAAQLSDPKPKKKSDGTKL